MKFTIIFLLFAFLLILKCEKNSEKESHHSRETPQEVETPQRKSLETSFHTVDCSLDDTVEGCKNHPHSIGVHWDENSNYGFWYGGFGPSEEVCWCGTHPHFLSPENENWMPKKMWFKTAPYEPYNQDPPYQSKIRIGLYAGSTPDPISMDEFIYESQEVLPVLDDTWHGYDLENAAGIILPKNKYIFHCMFFNGLTYFYATTTALPVTRRGSYYGYKSMGDFWPQIQTDVQSFGGSSQNYANYFQLSFKVCPEGTSGENCDLCNVNGKDGIVHNGKCIVKYSAPNQGYNWHDARRYCKTHFHGASDLPTIKSQSKLWAVQKVKGHSHSWMLLSDYDVPGTWEWMDGSGGLGSFSKWRTQYSHTSSNSNKKGHCMFVHENSFWQNNFCNNKKVTTSIVCEVDISELASSYSVNVQKNVQYRHGDWSKPFCDFENIPNCPESTKYCVGKLVGSGDECANGNGTCRFDIATKENYCECNVGREGDECEYNIEAINDENCERKDGYCYVIKKEDSGLSKRNWKGAREWCKDWHPAADLVVIPNENINSFLLEKIGTTTGTERFWIGALDAVEGDITWIDHSDIQSYRPFQDGGDEGNKSGFGEDCVDMRPSNHGKWSTSACDIQSWWICGLDLNDEYKDYSSNMWVNAYYIYATNAKKITGCNCIPDGPKPCPCGGNTDCFSC